MRPVWRRPTPWAALILLPCLGCGGRPPVSAGGAVSLFDVPVDDGTICFVPLVGGREGGAFATVTKGRYDIPSAAGLVPGRYRIEIRQLRNVGKKKLDPMALPGSAANEITPMEEAVPKRFNVDSTLEIELRPGQNALDFKLTAT